MTPIDYVRAGWALTPIPRGLKKPIQDGWQERDRACTTVERAATFHENVGLCHAYSGTCAIDIDDSALAVPWFNERGIDIQALWNAPDAVKIVGRPGRAKLLFKLATPLPTKQIQAPDGHMILELRCGTHRGTTAQDVLPPSVHPDTGQPYTWQFGVVGDWRELPEIPVALEVLWKQLVTRPARAAIPAPQGATADKIRELLTKHDPDVSYPEWVKVGQILHHETSGSDEGLALWDEWSLKGSKYNGFDELEYKWSTFGYHPNPATLASLRVDRVVSAADFEVVLPAAPPPPASSALATPAALAPANPPRRKFEFLSLTEFTNRPPPAWLVDDLVPKVELGVIYGQPGSGKTFFALDLALAISRGVSWRDKDVVAGRVCYVCAEGADGFAQRVRAAQQNLGVSFDDIDVKVLPARPNVFDIDQAKELCSEILACGPVSVVIMDTLTATTAGANLNDQVDMGAVVEHCAGIHQKTGALVLLIHHSGKDAARGMRGSNVLDGAAGFEIEIVVVAGVHIATVVKMKDGVEGDRYAFSLAPVVTGMNAKGKEIKSCVIKTVELSDAAPETKGEKFKGVALTVLECAQSVVPVTGGAGEVEALYQVARERLPAPEEGGRDRRRDITQRAIQGPLARKIRIEGSKFWINS